MKKIRSSDKVPGWYGGMSQSDIRQLTPQVTMKIKIVVSCLQGIRGQNLLLDMGRLNIHKHQGHFLHANSA